MKTIRMAILLCLACSTGPLLGADGFLSRRHATRLLDLFNLESRVREIPELMLQTEIQRDPNIATYADVYRKYFSDAISWEKIKPELVALLMQEFTDDELNRLVVFFDSDVGQKYLKVSLVLPQKISIATEKLLNAKVADLHKALEQRRGEIFEAQTKKMNKS